MEFKCTGNRNECFILSYA